MRTLKSFAAVTAAFMLTVAASGQVQPSGSLFMYDRNLSPTAVGLELGYMQTIGMASIVPISVGQLNGVAGTPGGPCMALSADGLLYPSSLVAGAPTDDKLGTLLTAADARGMKVYLGSLQTAGDWTTGTEFDSLRSCNKAVAAEVIQLYGSHPSLVGFYFTQELWLNWVKYYGSTYYGINLLSQFVSDIQGIDSTKTVFTAPVFKEAGNGAMPGLTASETGDAMNLLLFGSGLKLVAPQDGQGAQAGAPSLAELPGYYSAMQSAAQLNGAELWSIVETFVNNGGNQNQYPSAPISRIVQQIQTEGQYVSGMLTWMFGHDMSPQATYYPVAASQLYFDYQSYCCGVPAQNKLPFVYSYGSAAHPTGVPSQSYPDNQFTKLTDGQGGGFPYNGNDYAGFSDVEDGNIAEITIDLGQVRQVSKVRILVATYTGSGIQLPSSVTASRLLDLSGSYTRGYGTWAVETSDFPDTSDFSFGWIELDPRRLYTSEARVAPHARYLQLGFYHIGWLFVSEVEVYGE